MKHFSFRKVYFFWLLIYFICPKCWTNDNSFWCVIKILNQLLISLTLPILTQSEFQSGRNRTVFCVLVVKLTTTKHFGILGLTRITKKNVRPHTSCMGGGGRRAPPPDARENHVIRWVAERRGDREGIGATAVESATHRITWFSLAAGGGARRPPPTIYI